MKKVLLGTTAIVAAGMIVTPAVAAEKIKLGVGGYMEHWIGFASNEKDTNSTEFRSFDVQSDTEVHFSGSTTLDNGIKFAVKVEYEADGDDASSGQVDESWMEISSADFGNLRLGSDDIAPAQMHNNAPEYGAGYGDVDNWLPDGPTSFGTDTYLTLGAGDENKITYFSPEFFGFSFGASYVPEVVGNGNQEMPNEVDSSDLWAAAIKYSGEFGGVGIKADYGYGRRDGYTGVAQSDGQQAGLNIKFQGFEIGAGWTNTDIQLTSATASAYTGTTTEGNIYDFGVGYKSGPWGVSLSGVVSDVEGGVGVPGSTNGDNSDEMTIISLAGVYTLGPGIDLKGNVYHVDYDDESKTDASYNDGGWAVVAGFKLSF